MQIVSKLPDVGTTIFTVMSEMARRHNAINLAQGFPNFDCPEELKSLVRHYMAKGYNQYAPMPGVPELRRVIAQKISAMYGQAIDMDQNITVTSGATEAIFSTMAALIQPGDEVIVIDPAYDAYKPAVAVNGGQVKTYGLIGPEYEVDWQQFRRLVTPATMMIVLNNPHNPTGTILKKTDIENLQAITAGTDIVILSDEVYEHLVFDGASHQSILRYPDLFQRSVVTFSFGKTFHATGWKTGYCVAPASLMREFRKVHQYNVFSVNTPIQYALAEYLENTENYSGLNTFYEAKRDYFSQALEGSRFKALPCQGTYFQLYDYSAISKAPDTEFVKWLIEKYGVAAIPVSAFYTHPPGDRVLRFCFAKTEEVLQKAAAILQKV